MTESIRVETNEGKINKEINPILSWVEIENLGDNLKLVYPLMVKVGCYEDDVWIAECKTFNIFASGEYYEEALDNIKNIMAEDYNSFVDDYPDKLTKNAKDLLRLYCAFLGRDLPSKI